MENNGAFRKEDFMSFIILTNPNLLVKDVKTIKKIVEDACEAFIDSHQPRESLLDLFVEEICGRLPYLNVNEVLLFFSKNWINCASVETRCTLDEFKEKMVYNRKYGALNDKQKEKIFGTPLLWLVNASVSVTNVPQTTVVGAYSNKEEALKALSFIAREKLHELMDEHCDWDEATDDEKAEAVEGLADVICGTSTEEDWSCDGIFANGGMLQTYDPYDENNEDDRVTYQVVPVWQGAKVPIWAKQVQVVGKVG